MSKFNIGDIVYILSTGHDTEYKQVEAEKPVKCEKCKCTLKNGKESRKLKRIRETLLRVEKKILAIGPEKTYIIDNGYIDDYGDYPSNEWKEVLEFISEYDLYTDEESQDKIQASKGEWSDWGECQRTYTLSGWVDY